MPIIQTNKPLRPRPKNDFYPTPFPFAIAGLMGIPEESFHPDIILDPGCGKGVWGNASVVVYDDPEIGIVGVDDDATLIKPPLYDQFHQVDFLTWEHPCSFDLVCGNPPYRFAEEFVRKGIELLQPNGWLVYLMRLQFLGSAKRLKLWGELPPFKVTVCANRPSFTGDGKTNADEYCFMYWQKGWLGQPQLSWVLVK